MKNILVQNTPGKKVQNIAKTLEYFGQVVNIIGVNLFRSKCKSV